MEKNSLVHTLENSKWVYKKRNSVAQD
jgi:hypothetical protein